MSAHLALAARLDLPAAQPLTKSILTLRGDDVTIDAGEVSHLGGLCLQVLVSAAETWRFDGRALKFEPRSGEFDAALAMFGLTPEILQSEASA